MNIYGTGFGPLGLVQEYPLVMAAGDTRLLRPPVRPVSSIIVSVLSGTLDLFRGESATGVPWRCVPEIAYQWYLPPSDQYAWCIQAVNDLQASILLLGV